MTNLSHSGFVYLIECGGVYKVGCTTNIDRRIRSHQSGLPFPVKLVAYFSSFDHPKDETRIHGFLAKYKVQGKKEWFDIPECWLKRMDEWFFPECIEKTQEQQEEEQYKQHIRYCSTVLQMPSLAQKVAKLSDEDFQTLFDVCRRDYAFYMALVEDGAIDPIL